MNERRKQIILSEIKYWKQNNLLPAHYCDFLIALYGNGDEKEQGSKTSSILQNSAKKHVLSILLIVSTSVFLSFIIQFVNNGWSLMIGGIGIIVLISYAYLNRIKSNQKSILLYIMSALLLLQITINLWELLFFRQPMILIGLLILNCILWLVAGRFLKLLYFTLSGFIGLFCIIIFLVFQF